MVRGATGVPHRVLVVGGSSEIGAALARSWLGRGTRQFAITERAPGSAGELVRELEAGGAKVSPILLDVSDRAAIEPALDQVWSEGDVDVVVIAVGVLGSQEEIESKPSHAWEVMTVNATATIQIALETVKHMEEQQHGTIVLLSSVAGQRGRRDNYVYGASKAALDTFAEGLQQRLVDSNITALVVRPGYVYSKMSAGVQPAPLAVTVSQSADRILAGVDQGRDVVWVPPVLAVMFFVFRLLPRRVWAAIVGRFR